MNLQPINPPLRAGQRVVCIRCSAMTESAVADLDAPAGSFFCPSCVPTFTHDCEQCRFVRRTFTEGRPVDWYVCINAKGGLGGSVIGRTGNDGPDYWSMPRDMVETVEHGSLMLAQAKAILAEQTAR